MKKALEFLLKSIKVSKENLEDTAGETTDTDDMLLDSVFDTLKEQP